MPTAILRGLLDWRVRTAESPRGETAPHDNKRPKELGRCVTANANPTRKALIVEMARTLLGERWSVSDGALKRLRFGVAQETIMNSYSIQLTRCGTMALLTTLTSLASAQETNVPTPPPSPTPPALTTTETTTSVEPETTPVVLGASDEPVIDTATTQSSVPNRPLLITGSIFLVGSYGASAIVGAISDRSADEKLFYPVVGPWMDLSDRGCDTRSCSNETVNKVLLIGSGVGQGLGALGMLLSIVIPEKTTQNWYLVGNNELVVAPQLGANMTGLAAFGSF